MYNFRKVSNNLYRSSAPSVEDVIWLNKKLGINRIISLDFEAGNDIHLSCKLLDINHIKLPIDIGKMSSLINFIKEYPKLIKIPEKTLVHCIHGKDRTGLAIAIYRCQEDGWTSEEAIKEADMFRFCDGLSPEIRRLYTSIIEDADQTKDVNSASDIVDQSRENYDTYTESPSDNLSWSPYADRHVKTFPSAPITLSPEEGNPLGGFGPSLVGGGTVL